MEPDVSHAILDTVITQTTRMEELAEFYRPGLSLKASQPSGTDQLGFQLPGVDLGFDQVPEVQGNAPGAVSIWFRVDDLQGTFDRLVALGVTIKYIPVEKPWGDTLVAAIDPDGNNLGLS